MLGLGKKRDAPLGGNAVQRAQMLAAEGRSESDIIKSLKKEGFSNEDISRALNQILKMKVSGPPAGPAAGPAAEEERFVAPPPSRLEQMYGFEERAPLEGGNVIDMNEEQEIDLEELIEEIVSERWGDVADLVTDIKEELASIREQSSGLDGRVSSIETKSGGSLEDTSERFQELDMKLQGLEGRMSSVEKMLKDILPNLTENVRSLGKVLSKGKPKEEEFEI